LDKRESVKLKLSILCPHCKYDYFLLNKKEIKETTTETLFVGTHNYADTQYYLTCCGCNNTFKIVDQ
jgi:uncharacterized protein YbaR (Trm112 family)